MDGVTIVQTIDASYKVAEWNWNPNIGIPALIGIALGVLFAIIFARNLKALAAGIFLITASCVILLFGQAEYKEIPQTNYVIICTPDVTVKELTTKYRIIEQVAGGLVVTEKTES